MGTREPRTRFAAAAPLIALLLAQCAPDATSPPPGPQASTETPADPITVIPPRPPAKPSAVPAKPAPAAPAPAAAPAAPAAATASVTAGLIGHFYSAVAGLEAGAVALGDDRFAYRVLAADLAARNAVAAVERAPLGTASPEEIAAALEAVNTLQATIRGGSKTGAVTRQ